jgi:hypothetical protein
MAAEITSKLDSLMALIQTNIKQVQEVQEDFKLFDGRLAELETKMSGDASESDGHKSASVSAGAASPGYNIGIDPLSRNRRFSISAPGNFSVPLIQTNSPQRHIMIQPMEIDKSQVQQYLSIKAFMGTKRTFDVFRATHPDVPRRLADYLSLQIKEKLINSERSLNTELILANVVNDHAIHTIDDGLLMIVMARALRPSDKSDYQIKLFESISDCKPLIKGWRFGVQDYDKALYPVVNKILKEFEDLDEFFRLSATPEQMKRLPELRYGPDSAPETFNMMMQGFGDFRDQFATYVGKNKLKELTKLKDFIALLSSVNAEFNTLARTTRDFEVRATPVTKAAEAHQKVADRTTQERFRQGQQQYPRREQQQLNLVKANEGQDDEHSPARVFVAEKYATPPVRRPPGRLAVEEVREHQSELPCFDFLKTRTCKSGSKCPYSHDDTVLRRHVENRFSEFVKNNGSYLRFDRAIEILKTVSKQPTNHASAGASQIKTPSGSARTPFYKQSTSATHMEITGQEGFDWDGDSAKYELDKVLTIPDAIAEEDDQEGVDAERVVQPSGDY